MNKKILVIIPAYNEEHNIEAVISSLWGDDIDYVVINDCSKDKTKEILKSHKFNFIDLPVNLGIGGGMQTGYKYAYENDYDIAVQFDGDGQHEAKYIGELVQALGEDVDCVIGSRFITNEGFQSSFLRRIGINFLSWLINALVGTKVNDVTSGFRAVNKELIKVFAYEYAQDYPEPEAIMLATLKGFKIKEIPVIMHERTSGSSSIDSIKSVYYMVKVSIALIVERLTYKKG